MFMFRHDPPLWRNVLGGYKLLRPYLYPPCLRSVWTELEYICDMYRATHCALIKRLQTAKCRSPKFYHVTYRNSFKRDLRFSQWCCCLWDVKLCRWVSGSWQQFLRLQSYECLTVRKAIQISEKWGTNCPTTKRQISRYWWLRNRPTFSFHSFASYFLSNITLKSSTFHVFTMCTNINQNKRNFVIINFDWIIKHKLDKFYFSVYTPAFQSILFQSVSFLIASNCVSDGP